MFKFIKNLFGAKPTPLKISDRVETKAKQTKAKAATKVPTKAELKKLTKLGLEELGRDNGIELDRRSTKDKLVNELHKHLKG